MNVELGTPSGIIEFSGLLLLGLGTLAMAIYSVARSGAKEAKSLKHLQKSRRAGK